MKVLIVDDSSTTREMERGILAQLGCSQDEILDAASGEEGLNKVTSFDPDLVLVDGKMPDMDGVAFVRTIRGNGFTKPIMMVSSECERQRVLDAVQAGASDFVVKPFTPDLLSQRIEDLMGLPEQEPLI